MQWVIFLLFATIYVFSHDTLKKGARWRYLAGGTLFLFLARALLLTYATHAFWSAALPSKYLLPPYQPISYFLQYSLIHFFVSLLLTFAMWLAIGAILLFFNYRRPHLLMPGDVALLLIGMLLIQWPLVIPYMGVLLIGGILLLLFQRCIITKGKETITLTPLILFWIPFFLLFGNILTVFLGLQSLVMPL